MNQQSIITLKIGKRRIYEKICTCINGIFKTLPQTYIKVKFKKFTEDRYPNTYTQEMQDNSIKYKAAKLIKKQNKKIDTQEILFRNIIKFNNELALYMFICDQLENYNYTKPKQNEEINKLVVNNI